VVSRLEDFSAKVTTRLDNLDRFGMQDIIRTVVRRIEIDDSRIQVIFRVPSPDGPPGPRPPTKTVSWQHCTNGRRTVLRLDWAQSETGKGLRGHHPLSTRLPLRRINHAARASDRSCFMTFETASQCEPPERLFSHFVSVLGGIVRTSNGMSLGQSSLDLAERVFM
jgi:hypothetical protein